MDSPYATLPPRWPESAWLATACERAQRRLAQHPHGDLPRWRAALDRLPSVGISAELDRAAPELGALAADSGALRAALLELHPWRKGPFRLGGVTIDSEWRSDLKWQRVAPHVDLRGQRVLDVGSGNGYYGLRMLGAGARLVVGVDPTLLYVLQWLALRHFGGDLPNYVLPFGAEDLPEGAPGGPGAFDTVFSMGVLYHRRDHVGHLRRLRSWLRPRGRLVLETLVLPAGSENQLLRPAGRYARMPNVWGVPGTNRLAGWLAEAGYREVELLDVALTDVAEQRSTPWMRFESLEQALDPANPRLTVEGHPAPARALFLATSG